MTVPSDWFGDRLLSRRATSSPSQDLVVVAREVQRRHLADLRVALALDARLAAVVARRLARRARRPRRCPRLGVRPKVDEQRDGLRRGRM